MKIDGKCYDCQYEERKNEIGDMKKFEDAMRGNTMCYGTCEICKKYVAILPYGDMDRAIRYSNGDKIHWAEWD